MKTKLLFLAALFVASFQLINAQCTRSGTFVQSDMAYSISGTGNITFTIGGDKNVIFETGFMTVQGVDLRVYLSKMDDINTAGADAIEVTTSPLLGDNGLTTPVLSPITGMKTFPIPSSVELSDYDHIVIQCIGINERWGYVNLGPNTGTDCSAVLSVEENRLLDNVSFFPNPATDTIEISNDQQLNLNVSIFNVLGKQVINVNNVSLRKQTLNLSSLKSGVYLVQIEAEGNSITKKLVKR